MLSGDLYKTLVITSIKEEVNGVKTFEIASEDGMPIVYAPGQFITLVFDHHGREERRSFSISSSSVLSEPLSFTVKRIDNGIYSRWLHDRSRVGDRLYTTGAAGLFRLPENMIGYQQVFFFAAGIGITPIFSLIKTLLAEQVSIQIVLIYSNRSRDEAVFYDELMRLREIYGDRFKPEFLYSTDFNLARARLSKSLVAVLLSEYLTAPKQNVLCYVCGPYDYMRMAIWSLEEQGIPKDQIKRENFNTQERAILRAEPPDTEPHKVTVRNGKEINRFVCQYPDTILQASKKNHVVLPYSCEAGRCGSCAARCISGKVWLSYNEVLMDMDLKHGSILTCTGYPVGGDVVIDI